MVWLASTIICISSMALADEQMQVLAAGGDWVALAHSPSMTAAYDVCAAANMRAGLFLRYSAEDGIELRVKDERWVLPASVAGNVSVSVGGYTKDFTIAGNTADSVAAVVPSGDAVPLFDAMNKASVMTATAGKAKPFRVSLAGSAKAANAFLTCAGIRNRAADADGNPFR